jgi:hypothetical protein
MSHRDELSIMRSFSNFFQTTHNVMNVLRFNLGRNIQMSKSRKKKAFSLSSDKKIRIAWTLVPIDSQILCAPIY